MLCICEAAGVWDTFHQHMVSSGRHMRKYSEQYSKQLHDQLMNEVAFLQQYGGGVKLEPEAALTPVKCQDLANYVTGIKKKYFTNLQQVFQAAIGGYHENHTGNCLFFFAPCQAKAEAIDSNEVRDSKSGPSHTEHTDIDKPAVKKSASKKLKTKSPGSAWQPRSAAWLATVTFTAGLAIGAASCNIRKTPLDP